MTHIKPTIADDSYEEGYTSLLIALRIIAAGGGTDPQEFARLLLNSELLPALPDVPEVGTFTCIGKGGSYALIGTAIGAGSKRGSDTITVYRDTVTQQLYYRSEQDFDNRMALMANTIPPQAATTSGEETCPAPI